MGMGELRHDEDADAAELLPLRDCCENPPYPPEPEPESDDDAYDRLLGLC
jgi:hypothetical protein